MKTTKYLIHEKTGIEVEFDLDVKEMMEMEPEDYIEKNARIIKNPETQKRRTREEIISEIAELWPHLDDHDKREIIEIADLMRQGKWDRERKKTIEE
jgi:hypothetical protein